MPKQNRQPGRAPGPWGRARSGWLVALVLCAGCADAQRVVEGDAAPAPSLDAALAVDAGRPDVGWADARRPDPRPDRAPPPDQGPVDAGLVDAGPVDAGPVDAGPLEDASPDATPDAAAPEDAGCVPGPERCNGLDDDCDGRLDEALPLFWPDRDGDGFGAPLGVPGCAAGEGLADNSLDCDDTDPAVHPDAADPLGGDFADTNCDGVDGVRAALLFVDAEPVRDARDGTPERPFETIAEALAVAAQRPGITGVALSRGRYPEAVTLVEGVSLYGGFNRLESWRRSARDPVVIAVAEPDRGRLVGVQATDLRAETVLQLLEIEVGDHPAPGGSSYGIHARNAPGLVLEAVRVTAGAGAAGLDGRLGADGEAGGPGQDGGACGRPPGAGGASPCGATGGAGGAGAPRAQSGAPGGPPGCGGAGGPRGGGGAGADGGHGCNPAPPGAGADGPGGAAGGLDALGDWETAAGGDGAHGPHGPPGGGGGGGGGAAVIDGTGGGGAGGGAGGCGGRAGLGGQGGGGSFALFAVASAGLRVERSVLVSGPGGTGGSGGWGGAGGAGAPGGRGGSGRQAFACGGLAGPGAGGDGGRGADGGRGGHGGGGAGGPSVPVVCVDGAVALGDDTVLRPGQGGAAGESQAAPGAPGVSAASLGCE